MAWPGQCPRAPLPPMGHLKLIQCDVGQAFMRTAVQGRLGGYWSIARMRWGVVCPPSAWRDSQGRRAQRRIRLASFDQTLLCQAGGMVELDEQHAADTSRRAELVRSQAPPLLDKVGFGPVTAAVFRHPCGLIVAAQPPSGLAQW